MQVFYIIFEILKSFFSLNRFFIEQQTKSPLPVDSKLDKPVFSYVHKAYNKVFDTVCILWTPNLEGNPGSHFFVKYK
jgi:neuronal cell adhesion molecule